MRGGRGVVRIYIPVLVMGINWALTECKDNGVGVEGWGGDTSIQ